jgi:hypothetical protein
MKGISMRLFGAAALLFVLSAAAPASPVQPKLKEWTFLVFINADNNLDANGPEDINEMEKVGSTDQIDVVVQMDREGATGTWRYHVQKDADPAQVTSPIVEALPEQDMGSPDTFRAFLRWGMQKYPAKKYFVVLWNHGSGWEKGRFGTRGISYDDDSGNHLTVQQVGQVMAEIAAARGEKTELLGYDACLMQMAEVAAEVTGSCNYQVASEETEPLDGWPYDDFLEKVAAHPEWNGAEVGRALVETFQASYTDGGSQGGNDTTLSVIDLTRFAELKIAVDLFTRALANAAVHEAAVAAIYNSQSYAEPDHKDLVDFLDQVLATIPDAGVQSAAKTLRSILTEKIVLASASTGEGLECSRGLAIWLPTWFTQCLMDRYRTLSWATCTQWDELVDSVGTIAGGDDEERARLRRRNHRRVHGN